MYEELWLRVGDGPWGRLSRPQGLSMGETITWLLSMAGVGYVTISLAKPIDEPDTVTVSAAPQRQLDTLRDQVTAYRAEYQYAQAQQEERALNTIRVVDGLTRHRDALIAEVEQLAGRVSDLEALREMGGDDSRECGGCSSGFAKVAGRYMCVDCGREMVKR